MESERWAVWTMRNESGRYSETRIGQIISRENEYDQCEHGKTGEEHQKQNNNLGENEILEARS